MEHPVPPRELQVRVGGSPDNFDELGAVSRRDFLALLPPSFEWDGARVLDFGCGAGRTLRHFRAEANRCEVFWGCDIDAESVEWVAGNLDPPFRAVQNDELPPLPFDDDTFDLAYCMSVFTHLGASWSAWLAELHRVLKPGGLLLATTLGPGAVTDLGRAWDEERTGMLLTLPEHSWDLGGPVVFASEWWLREHWGRAFEVLEYWPWGFGSGGPVGAPLGQGCAALRARPVSVTVDDLERPSGDPREWDALRHNLAIVQDRERAWRERAMRAEAELAAIHGRRSWRLAQLVARLGKPAARRPKPSG